MWGQDGRHARLGRVQLREGRKGEGELSSRARARVGAESELRPHASLPLSFGTVFHG